MRGARGMIVVLGVKVPVGQRGLGRGAVWHISQSWLYGLRYGTALVGREN